ncbi:hypothetical protein BJB45_18910 [Halomonas huangheensis]|uniref:Uncharacterized protein n=1 Tax=Halomonas huangheensis TaxID=1178482 RepID=W1NBR5_9GAMM|nr:hypothetical protein BJB45_18910 [Halomonas huangheensis]
MQEKIILLKCQHQERLPSIQFDVYEEILRSQYKLKDMRLTK